MMQPVTDEEIKLLIEKARATRENAFIPRSEHKIGAAILSTDNAYFGGCNIESNISGLGTCAERAAIDNAITNGKYEFKAILTYDEQQIEPCGACLQYLFEFYQITNIDVAVVSADTQGNITIRSLLKLLPDGYLAHHDLDKIRSYRNKN